MSVDYRSEEPAPTEEPAYGPPVASGPPYYTWALLVSIVAVTLAQFAVGLDRSIDIASFDKMRFLQNHEYWLILTGAALHGGLLHLFMNGYALYNIGSLIEFLSNRAHVAIVFLLAVIGGGILSLILLPDGRSVGASGGIVGLLGYLVVYAFKRRQFISPQFRRSLLINIGVILLFGFALYNVIDNWGHIGGLVTGALYGLIQIPSDEYTDPRVASLPTRILGVAALTFFVLVCSFTIVLLLAGH
jgi:membrane associated rhomboid family serine protease